MAFGLAFGIAALAWFAVGPAGGQRVGLAIVAPVYAGLIAVGQLRVAVDPRLRPAAKRFWRVLSFSMFTYMAGMLVNLTALVFGLHAARDAGETLFYPVAAVFSVVALVVFPTAVRSVGERLRMSLDVATVLFGSATFVWYFLVSQRWRPANGWAELADGVVLPGLILVVGFVILRIMMAGANVISRPTAAGFVFGASCIAVPVILDAEAGTAADRVGALVHLAGFLSCLVAIAIQRQVGLAGDGQPAAWRRSFTVLPYGAVAATLSLLLWVVKPHLDYRSWFVAIAALALCAAVVARQVVSLWETSRLLRTNRELTARLQHRAYHDELTGLANRALFTEHVAEAVAQTCLDGSTAAVLFVDLDDFKFVNDSLGHQVGDQLLAAVASRLRTVVPTRGFLARLGGDEFALLTVAGGDGEGYPARAVAEKVIAALREPFVVSGQPVDVQASIGIAAATRGAPGIAELLRNADIAMYAAKKEHKGGWRFFEPAMLTAVVRRHQLRAALADAVICSEFAVFYQPIVDLLDGSIHGAEALVRWRRPGAATTSPGDFIPLAEETGLVVEIDRFVLNAACREAARWPIDPSGGRPLSLHVNLSARHLHRPDLVDDVAQALYDSGLRPDRLTLEITESGLGHDHEGAIGRLGELVRIGVRLAIDDFGTGYSSLAYLRRMPVDVLKIDKAFTGELTGAVAAPLAQAVIALAAALGMQTVAEGIEELEQVERLLALGCRYGQGYHYGRPMPAEQITNFLCVSFAAADSSLQADRDSAAVPRLTSDRHRR
ncbi:MAG TPA: EAL domain-containing protein [Candidatus Limnocylindrales bacterium]|nr:EAL domain-containing protein [Candidatus Limnocylindrales bacterium]